MLLFIKYFLSILVAFLTIGGALYMFSIDRLKYYETKLKLYRLIIGSLMILSALFFCYVYEKYGHDILNDFFNPTVIEKSVENKEN